MNKPKKYKHSKYKSNENWEIIDPKTLAKELVKKAVELPSINEQVLETLCSYHCTKKEICNVLAVTFKELESFVQNNYKKKWSEFYNQKSAKGKAKIRENMIKLSAKSPEMAKELKKEYLNSPQEVPKKKVGRPAMFETPEELQERIDSYFEECDTLKKEPYTMTGLTLALGFVNRQSLLDYKEKPEFTDIIKRAKTKVEYFYEKQLHSGQVVAGIIFGLKANFSWQDKSQIDHTTNGKDINPGKIPTELLPKPKEESNGL